MMGSIAVILALILSLMITTSMSEQKIENSRKLALIVSELLIFLKFNLTLIYLDL